QMDKRFVQRMELIRNDPDLPENRLHGARDAKVGFVGYGGVYGPILEAIERLDAQGTKAKFLEMRTLWPFAGQQVREFVDSCDVQQTIMGLVNDLGVPLENIFALSGIGCSSKEPEMLRVNAYQGQHGRSLPVAIGVAIANPGLKVLDFGGDGDTYAIGMEHFMHAIIRNVNVTLIVMNNQVYGLTKGQASPTAHTGLRTPSTPDGK